MSGNLLFVSKILNLFWLTSCMRLCRHMAVGWHHCEVRESSRKQNDISRIESSIAGLFRLDYFS